MILLTSKWPEIYSLHNSILGLINKMSSKISSKQHNSMYRINLFNSSKIFKGQTTRDIKSNRFKINQEWWRLNLKDSQIAMRIKPSHLWFKINKMQHCNNNSLRCWSKRIKKRYHLIAKYNTMNLKHKDNAKLL